MVEKQASKHLYLHGVMQVGSFSKHCLIWVERNLHGFLCSGYAGYAEVGDGGGWDWRVWTETRS